MLTDFDPKTGLPNRLFMSCRSRHALPSTRLTGRECSIYVPAMGGKDPNRQPRVGSVRETPSGWLRLLTCNTCAHCGVLPAERLTRKHGELALLEFALTGVQCTACQSRGATMTMVRLCEAGCPRRR